MALSLPDLWLVNSLKTRGYLPAGSAVIEVGAQQVDDSILTHREELTAIAQAFAVHTPPPPLEASFTQRSHRLVGMPMSREIWEWLGFAYAAIDIDGSPSSIPLDLNCDEIPAEAKAKYQLVTNFGTTEHVANQAHAFKIIHDLTAVNGVMIHNLPCHQIGHGLFGYNPKFFWALARSNNYRTLLMDIGTAPAKELPDYLVSSICEIMPDFAERWRRYRATPCDVYVALQKEYDFDYVPPLDLVDGATTDDPVLKRRYWTVLDRKALQAIEYSREAQVEQRKWGIFELEQKLADREETVQAREAAVYLREQKAAKLEYSRMRWRAAISRRLPWLGAIKRRVLGTDTKRQP